MNATENDRSAVSSDATRRHVLMLGAATGSAFMSPHIAQAGEIKQNIGEQNCAPVQPADATHKVDAAWVRGISTDAPFSSGAMPPCNAAPPGAVDTHHHIFSDNFLTTEGKPLPISAEVKDYNALKRRLGISRSIVVAASPYGTDNSCLVAALDQFGLDASRGVALVDPEVKDAQLDELGRHGVRGLRIYLAKNRIPTVVELRQLAARAADRNWVLQIVGNRDREVIFEWTNVLARLPCNIVIDHFGWAPQPAGPKSNTAGAIRRLIEGGRAYVKLSGLYLSSRSGPPDYRDVDELALDFVRQSPERVLWGSDWPHPVAFPYIPDDALMFDKLAGWAPDAAIRQQILVTNPDRLFWLD